MAKKRKPGPKKSENPRIPVHWRVRKDTLEALRKRADSENRKMNTVVELILERELT